MVNIKGFFGCSLASLRILLQPELARPISNIAQILLILPGAIQITKALPLYQILPFTGRNVATVALDRFNFVFLIAFLT